LAAAEGEFFTPINQRGLLGALSRPQASADRKRKHARHQQSQHAASNQLPGSSSTPQLAAPKRWQTNARHHLSPIEMDRFSIGAALGPQLPTGDRP